METKEQPARAGKIVPQYKPDQGALTTAQMKQLLELAGKVETSFVRSSLFGPAGGLKA